LGEKAAKISKTGDHETGARQGKGKSRVPNFTRFPEQERDNERRGQKEGGGGPPHHVRGDNARWGKPFWDWGPKGAASKKKKHSKD